MAEEEVGLRLALKNRHEVVSGIDDVGDKLNRAGDEAERAGRKAKFGAAGFLSLGKSGKLAGRAVLYGTGAMTAGIVGAGIVLGKFTKDAVKGWEEHQQVAKTTASTIKATGGAANLTARQVGHLSDVLERKTGVDGDVIQSGANMLLTFKNVRNEQGAGNDIFTQSLSILNDMSSFMKTDASKSAVQLGKALNDPIKGVSALSKVGVTFSDEQKTQIENFVKQNQMAKAQKIILGELSSEFGGAAKAQETMGDRVLVGYHALQDTLGKAILPLQHDFQRFLITDGIPAAQHFADVFAKDGVPVIEKYARLFRTKGIPAIRDFLDEAKPVAESVLPAIGSGLKTTAGAVKVLAPKLVDIFEAFNDLPDWAKSGIALGVGGGALASKLGLTKLAAKGGSTALGLVSKAKPLPVFVVNELPGGVGGKGSPGGLPPIVPGGPEGGPARGGLRGKIGGFGKGLAPFLPILPGISPDVLPSPKMVGGIDEFNAAIGRTSGSLAKTKAAAADLDRVMRTDGQTVQESVGRWSGLGSTLSGKTRPAIDNVLGGARTLGQALKALNITVRPRVLLDGVSAAQQQIATLNSGITALNSRGDHLLPYVHGGTHRANGGPVHAGQTYIVGEHRPEVFVPKVDGYIHPRVPDMPSFDDSDWGSHGGGAPMVVQVMLDRRVLAEATFDVARDKLARA